MAVLDQEITDNWAVYNGDNCEVLPTIPDESVHLSVYSPPFACKGRGLAGLYQYSSSEHDFCNSRSYEEFFIHYEFLVKQIHRVTLRGRISAVHTMETPNDGANAGAGMTDFPGDVIRLHESLGWQYIGRHCVWKEPLGVRNRTMAKGLTHQTVVEDSSLCDMAGADYLLLFRRLGGENPIPIVHPNGLLNYAGERQIPPELLKYRGWKGKQTENRYSQWIWRQYASAFWDDVRIECVLPYEAARDADEEKHMHPLQLDVIERVIVLRSNPGEVVLTPFMGVGSEVYGAVLNGRKGLGVELKPTYFRQALKNLPMAFENQEVQEDLFATIESEK